MVVMVVVVLLYPIPSSVCLAAHLTFGVEVADVVVVAAAGVAFVAIVAACSALVVWSIRASPGTSSAR